MMVLLQFGTDHYLVTDSLTFRLTWPQYQALRDFDRGLIQADDLPDRTTYYEAQEAIPFDGRPLPGPERTVEEFYGIERR